MFCGKYLPENVRVTQLQLWFSSISFFQSSIDVAASVVLLLSTLTIKDPYQVWNTGILASLECRLWNTEFLLWSLFISSTYHMIMMTVERYEYRSSFSVISFRFYRFCRFILLE